MQMRNFDSALKRKIKFVFPYNEYLYSRTLDCEQLGLRVLKEF